MNKDRQDRQPSKQAKPKQRRLGVSAHRLVEFVPREIADAEIEKMFEESKLFPDE